MCGNEIKAVRLAHGITQEELAKACGIPQSTISWIESDKGIVSIQHCIILADYYGITIDELIGREIKEK